MIDWDGLAQAYGYSDPAEMIKDLYWNHGMSTHEIGDKLVVSHGAVVSFMKKHGIPFREKIATLKSPRSGPPCPHCGGEESRVVCSRGLSERGFYERERRCKSCGKWFKTMEMAGGVRTARVGTCLCSYCQKGIALPLDVVVETGAFFSCEECGKDTVVVLMKKEDYLRWLRRKIHQERKRQHAGRGRSKGA